MNRFSVAINKRGDFAVADRALNKVIRLSTLSAVCDLSKNLNAGTYSARDYNMDLLDESWNVAKDES